jgi:hypothetical protein
MTDWERSHDWVIIKQTSNYSKIVVRFQKDIPSVSELKLLQVDKVGNAHPTGLTRLKLWAFKTLKNTISNIFSDRFTHSFSLVSPLQLKLKLNSQFSILN